MTKDSIQSMKQLLEAKPEGSEQIQLRGEATGAYVLTLSGFKELLRLSEIGLAAPDKIFKMEQENSRIRQELQTEKQKHRVLMRGFCAMHPGPVLVTQKIMHEFRESFVYVTEELNEAREVRYTPVNPHLQVR